MFFRCIARIQAENPIVVAALAFVVGQLSAALLSPAQSCIAVAILLLIQFLLRQRSWVPLLLVSGLLSLNLRSSAALPEEILALKSGALITTVVAEPRFRKVGQVEVDVRVSEYLVYKEGKLTTHALPEAALLRCRGVYLPWRNLHGVKEGDMLVLRADLRPVSRSAIFGYEASLKRRGIAAQCRIRQATKLSSMRAASYRERLLTSVQAKLGDGEKSGLFLSLAFGFRDQLSQETEEAFRRTGLAHTLVFSGHQLTLCFISFLWLIRVISSCSQSAQRFRLLRECSFIAALTGLVFFMHLVSPDVSVVRAAIASLIMAAALIFERGGGMLQRQALSLLCLHILWPACLLEPGVQLTFAALAGLSLGASLNFRLSWLKAVGACFYAGIATSLVVLFWFGDISIVSIALNLTLAPLLTFVACNVGVPSYLLSISGASVIPLLLTAEALAYLRELVFYCSSFDWIHFKVEGWGAWTLGAGLGAILLARCWGVLLEMRQRENLW